MFKRVVLKGGEPVVRTCPVCEGLGVTSNVLQPAWHSAPVDLDHIPFDYAEAIEMLRRAKRDIEALTGDRDALNDLLKAGQKP